MQIRLSARCIGVVAFLSALVSCRGTEPIVRLYAFDCGVMRLSSIEHFNIGENETAVRDLAVPCYVIQHRRGTLLWDGGLPSERAAQSGWQEVAPGYFERLDRTLADQLDGLGLAMASFDFVAFSHMHYDHVGVANEIEGGTLLIQGVEYAAAFTEEVGDQFMDRSTYDGLQSLERTLLDGPYDIFGDGRVRIVPAPGHTPGHQVLFVDLEEEGPVILAGDLYHFRLSRAERRVPTFNWSADETLQSYDRIEALVEESGADLWIAHDLAGFEARARGLAFHR